MSDTPLYDELAKQFELYGIRVEPFSSPTLAVEAWYTDVSSMVIERQRANEKAFEAALAASMSPWIQGLVRDAQQ